VKVSKPIRRTCGEGGVVLEHTSDDMDFISCHAQSEAWGIIETSTVLGGPERATYLLSANQRAQADISDLFQDARLGRLVDHPRAADLARRVLVRFNPTR
jgi:hypothetical protein